MNLYVIFFIILYFCQYVNSEFPIIVTTWQFVEAAGNGWAVLKKGGSAIDAVESGGTLCEELQCDGTVGFGGSPDENGETTLDALIIDGKTMNVGAVAALRKIKSAISVARNVLERTKHSILAGQLASDFAIQMGFEMQSLTTKASKKIWRDWHKNSCQPNFWMNVLPDPTKSCGPYVRDKGLKKYSVRQIDRYNHDTISIIAIDSKGDIAAGTSTNGAKHKIPGRVGDSPIPGAGAYADNNVGAAAATGDGDVMLRFLPSYLAVELMRNGATPISAATTAINRIKEHYPTFMGAVIALNKNGEYGAACNGMDKFPFIVRSNNFKQNITFIECSDLSVNY